MGTQWFVTWGTESVNFGLGPPLTRWQRLRVKIKAPYWRAKYLVEDICSITANRVRGAWRVLLGRSIWL
jgi:hypothetical protein